jgi:bifunctional non-homologous end joining protein LigD
MPLQEYRRKRDFLKSPEPRGKRQPGSKTLCFVIQKHAASHLHYDFRLELDGVLKSWAVPKGPDLEPATKRLAMHVEDHPLEYAEFEGTIPQGEYGGGTVMLWDRGTWEPLENPQQAYREGRLKFTLHGEKLHGGWMLVRRGGKNASADERHWFLFKEKDRYAKGKKPIVESKPNSVATGRSLEEIAEDQDRVWSSKGAKVAKKKRASRKVKKKAKVSTKAKRSKNRSPKTELSQTIAGVHLTHPEKILYPEQGLTKRDLAEYYERVAPWMLPWVIDRPLALVRCPAGESKQCFFQKHPGQAKLQHLREVDVSETPTTDYNLAIKDAASLVELAQLGVLEIHIWGSKRKRLERPDQLIFDLDPDPAVEWPDVIRGAKEIRLVLEELGLVAFLKTTGGKGLHLVVPIQPRTSWEDAKAFCKAVADFVERAAPDRYVAKMSKAARKGKIFVDYLRNGRGATAIAPYSTRAKPKAPVSVPIGWDELRPRLRSDTFTISNLFARLDKLKQDPWVEMPKIKQSIKKSMIKSLQV